ncbi:MAG: alpha/beta fold hydrolase [Pseudomonadota bacterium]
MTTPSTTGTPAAPEIGKSMKLNGMVVNYHDVGTGSPVLLIHGSGPGVTAWANWRLTIPELSKHARVIAPDMAGFGYTSVDGTAIPDRAMWLSQLTGLLDGLGLQRVSLVGNSFGGGLALAFAHAFPERVDKLVLMGAVGVSFPISEGLNKVWGYTPSLEAMRELLGIFVYDSSFVSEDLVEMRYRASTRADVQQRFAALFPEPRQQSVDRLALSAEQLSSIRAGTLIIHGRQDKVIPLAVSEKLKALLPESRLEVIEKCGHWVQIEHPQQFTQLVMDFLFPKAPALTKNELMGRWSVCSWVQAYDDGRKVFPMGEEVTGFIQYGHKYMSCLIARKDRPPFKTGGQWNATAEEKAAAYGSFLSYSGTYAVDGQQIIHKVTASLFPNWVGGEQRRTARMQDGRLHLEARLEEGTPQARTAVLVWEKSED